MRKIAVSLGVVASMVVSGLAGYALSAIMAGPTHGERLEELQQVKERLAKMRARQARLEAEDRKLKDLEQQFKALNPADRAAVRRVQEYLLGRGHYEVKEEMDAIKGPQQEAIEPRQIRPLNSYHYVDHLSVNPKTGGYLTASGTWHSSHQTYPNVVDIICHLDSRECELRQADIVVSLHLHFTYFGFASLDEKQLTATSVNSDSCTREVLSIDRQAKAVSLIRYKIGSDEKACGSAQEGIVAVYLLGGPAS